MADGDCGQRRSLPAPATTSSVSLVQHHCHHQRLSLKCVLFEPEDVSEKETVSDLYLSISLGNPVGGTCPTTPSGSSTIGLDASYDLKHMVSYSGSLHNKCPYITIHKGEIAGSSITAHTYCIYGDQNDSWPN